MSRSCSGAATMADSDMVQTQGGHLIIAPLGLSRTATILSTAPAGGACSMKEVLYRMTDAESAVRRLRARYPLARNRRWGVARPRGSAARIPSPRLRGEGQGEGQPQGRPSPRGASIHVRRRGRPLRGRSPWLPLTPALSPSPSGPLWRGRTCGWPEGGGERGPSVAAVLPRHRRLRGDRFVIEGRRADDRLTPSLGSCTRTVPETQAGLTAGVPDFGAPIGFGRAMGPDRSSPAASDPCPSRPIIFPAAQRAVGGGRDGDAACGRHCAAARS